MQFGTFNEKKKIIQLKPTEPCSVVFGKGKKKDLIPCRGFGFVLSAIFIVLFPGRLNLEQLASYIEKKERKI